MWGLKCKIQDLGFTAAGHRTHNIRRLDAVRSGARGAVRFHLGLRGWGLGVEL